MAPEAMRYHGPGWALDTATRDEWGDVLKPGATYQPWAPQDGVITDPHGYADYQASGWAPRGHWAAAISGTDGGAGDAYEKGPDAASVLRIFPEAVAAQFAAVVRSC